MRAGIPFFLLPITVALALSKPATIVVYPPPPGSSTLESHGISGTSTAQVRSGRQVKSVSVSAPEANAILSHHLGIAKYETLPKGLKSGNKAQLVFGVDDGQEDFGLGEGEGAEQQHKVVMVIYGAGGNDVVPTRLANTTEFQVWTPPPPSSWDSLFGIYIGRFVHAFDVSISSLFGAESFLSSHLHEAGMVEWARDWENKVVEWVKWGQDQLGVGQVKAQVMPKDEYSRWLTEYGVADLHSKTIMEELAGLDSYIEGLSSEGQPPLSMLRFAGLLEIERRYSTGSRQYTGAVSLIQAILSGATEALLSKCPQCKVIVVSVPPAPLFARNGKRTASSILATFKTSDRSFASQAMLDRRSEVFGQGKRAPKSTVTPIVASWRTCYESLKECEAKTDTCNGHGQCVEGVRTVGGTCYVCKCGSTEDEQSGQRVSWSGEYCQKQDVSSDFVLLAGSTIGLILLFAASVALLAGVGAESLPQQLASVSGPSKKLD